MSDTATISSKSAKSFPKNFPASALITVTRFVDPDMIVEVQGVAVIGGV